MPLVSVVVPTYNCARYVTAAVDSVLAQSFTDMEVLVVDDGSTDDTRPVLAGYGLPVRYLYQTNTGVSAARNHGIAESRGRYVAFLDADDTWLPQKLERQVAELASSPAMGCCYSAFLCADDELRPLRMNRSQRSGNTLEDLLLRGNVVGTPSTVLAERELLERAGGFDTDLSQCADWDMWLRLARYTEFLYLDEPLATYRQHANNMSRSIQLLERDSLHLLRKALADPSLSPELGAQEPRIMGHNWLVLAGSYYQVHAYRDFARCAAMALQRDRWQGRRLLGYPFRRISRQLSRSFAQFRV